MTGDYVGAALAANVQEFTI